MESKNLNKKVIVLISIILLIIILFFSSIILINKNEFDLVLNALIFFISFCFVFFFIIGLVLIWSIVNLKNEKHNTFFKPIITLSMKVMYMPLIWTSKLLKVDKNIIRNVYARLNNKIILNQEFSIEPEDILVLTPHCLQKSTCIYKVTYDSENCKKCGKCNIHNLLDLKEKYGVNFEVATGGTLARKKIISLRPKAIIAIACERDLISGIQDVSGIPVLGIINLRPEGPCINTKVDYELVEKGIKHFIKK